jgi:hypothetical protein
VVVAAAPVAFGALSVGAGEAAGFTVEAEVEVVAAVSVEEDLLDCWQPASAMQHTTASAHVMCFMKSPIISEDMRER